MSVPLQIIDPSAEEASDEVARPGSTGLGMNMFLAIKTNGGAMVAELRSKIETGERQLLRLRRELQFAESLVDIVDEYYAEEETPGLKIIATS